MSDYSALDQADTQTAFAALVGISPPAVSGLVSRGVIAKGQTMRQWLDAYLRHLRAVAAGRGEEGEEVSELTRARIREANAKAHKAEVETARELGLLVPAAEVEPALRNWAARGALALEGAERRILDGIRSEFSITLEDRHVRDHVRAAQRDIAAYAANISAVAEAGRLGVGAAGAGPDGAVRGNLPVSGPGDE